MEKIAYFTTLAGYIHWKLTGEKVLGVGEASGMFPIDAADKRLQRGRCWSSSMRFVAPKGTLAWKLYEEILPKVLVAGENAQAH